MASSWLGNWGRRIKITVDSTDVSSPLTHFPLPIFLGSSVGKNNQDVTSVFDEIGGNYKKIAITKNDGQTQLYVEVEKWDSVNEEAVLWVSKSDFVIDSATDTVIYLYYDNTQPDNTAYVEDSGSRPEVWDSDFKGVWHLGEDPSGTAPQMSDSTSNSNDGTSAGSMTSDDSVDGRIGNALDLDGIDDHISVSDNASLDELSEVSVFAWIKPKLTGNPTQTIIDNWESSDYGYVVRVKTDGEVNAWLGDNGSHNGGFTTSGAGIVADSWQLIGITYDGSLLKVYRNGNEVGSDNGYSGSLGGTGIDVWIGGRAAGGSYFLKGIIDEARISASARNSNWIGLEYDAGSDNLLTFAGEEKFFIPKLVIY